MMNCKLVSAGKKRVLRFNCGECPNDASLSKTPECLNDIIEGLEEYANIDKIVLDSDYVHEYKGNDLNLLRNFVNILENTKYRILKTANLNGCGDCREERKSEIEEIWRELKMEPLEGLARLKQIEAELSESCRRGSKECQSCREKFLKKGIKPSIEKISKSELVSQLEEAEEENIFSPKSRPSFLRSKLALDPPKDANMVDAYKIDETKVRIYHSSQDLEYIYFIIPPEYDLSPRHVQVIQESRHELLEKQGNLEPNPAKEEIRNRSKQLIIDNVLEKNLDLEESKIEALSDSLAKFTAGLGIIETLLEDQKVQDIYVDAPVGENPIYIYHQEYEECNTNIYLTPQDAQVLTSRFRAISGRPFSEANPTLDLNLGKVRVAAIQNPLSPDGLAMAIRRHKSTPWTLPLFISKDFMTPKAAGLLSLIVDSQASVLITGSRGAGKTSLLGALMLELLPKYRILCLEDTAELPVDRLKTLGFKAQRLQVQPSSSGSKLEMETEDALRSALRLGESVLIMGEVRGPETRSLYEAMRVGAAGNSVMGTIHGSSTKDVYERVVYDLDIPPSSFKATDVIAVASPIRSKGSIERKRRLVQISEVGKDWREDPLSEDGFTDLLSYDPERDRLRVTEPLKDKDSGLLESISDKWTMSLENVKKNMNTRARIQKYLVEKAEREGNSTFLEAETVVKSNLAFHRFLEKQLEAGGVDYDRLFSSWKDWLDRLDV